MATDTDTTEGSAFGRVSRTKGVVFRYVLLAGTLAGIVALGALLVYVAADALEPLTAGSTWYLVYAGALLLPTVGVLGVLYRHPDTRRFGVTTTGLLIAGAFGAAALVVLFVIVEPLAWLAHVLGVAVAALAYAGYRRLRSGPGAAEMVLAGAALLGLALAGVPSVVPGIPHLVQFEVPVVPSRYVIFLLTLALPTAALVGVATGRRLESRRAGLVASTLVVLVSLSVMFQVVLAPGDALLVLLGVAVPTGYFVGVTLTERREVWPGLLLPAALFGGVLLARTVADAMGVAGPTSWLDWQFLTSLPSSTAVEAGIYPGLVGSVMLMIVVVLLAFPVGVGAAIYLEEYAADGRLARIIQVNISNLAGVPSVVYGLLGLGLFVNVMDLVTGSLLVGGMTLALLILPIVVISAQEAIRAVPDAQRQAAYGMGATRWQTVRTVVLPDAIPGILTGTILAIGRALGETAPLIMIAAPATVFGIPDGLSAKTSAMPLQIYDWAFLPEEAFRHGVTAAGVVTLLVVLLTLNSIAIVVRNRYQREGRT
jgi:phosphate transport system permease protein